MSRKVVDLYFATLLIIFAVLASCTKEPDLTGGEGEFETLEQGFTIGTRGAIPGNPQHGDAYTLISYRVGGTSSTETYKNQISELSQRGYYAYDDGLISGRPEGTFVPVTINIPSASDIPPFSPSTFYIPSAGIHPLVMNRAQAQTLAAAPVNGLNPSTNAGLYRTAVIYPAIPLQTTSTAGLGYLAVYHISTEIWASNPDDADGDPYTDDPFEILVDKNRTVHPLPEKMELYPVKSAISVSFYSEYFADNDPEMTTPKSQTFTITSLKLVNVGSNGWYNARTGIVYPNYNYGSLPNTGNNAGSNWQTLYSATEMGVNPDGTPIYPQRGAYNFTDLLDPNHDGNRNDSMVKDENGNNKLPPKHPGFPDPTKYIQWSTEVPVFPSDYRGGENGGLTQVKPLSLRLELNVGGAPLKATVPIAIVMERGKKYNFYINVMSEMIGISYHVSSWEQGGGGTGDIGNIIDYFEIKYQPDGWNNGGGGTDDIGN